MFGFHCYKTKQNKTTKTFYLNLCFGVNLTARTIEQSFSSPRPQVLDTFMHHNFLSIILIDAGFPTVSVLRSSSPFHKPWFRRPHAWHFYSNLIWLPIEVHGRELGMKTIWQPFQIQQLAFLHSCL